MPDRLYPFHRNKANEKEGEIKYVCKTLYGKTW